MAISIPMVPYASNKGNGEKKRTYSTLPEGLEAVYLTPTCREHADCAGGKLVK